MVVSLMTMKWSTLHSLLYTLHSTLYTLVLKSCRKGYLEHLPFWCSEKKIESQTWGRNGPKKNWVQEILGLWFFPAVKKNRVQDNLRLCFFLDHFSPMSGTCFFSEHQNSKCSRYPFLQLFRTRVLDTHYGGLKASCIGPALSKFHLSVWDGAT